MVTNNEGDFSSTKDFKSYLWQFFYDLSKEQKENFDELGYTSIILPSSDAVLRKFGKIKITKEL